MEWQNTVGTVDSTQTNINFYCGVTELCGSQASNPMSDSESN